MRIDAARPEQLEAISAALRERPRALHAERMGRQQSGESLYLVAWLRELPVGHVVVGWSSWPERRWAAEWHARYGCSFVEDLWVEPGCRDQGIGRALMRAAENHSFEHCSRVGLHVGQDEGYRAASHIYRSTGYFDPGHGTFIESSPGVVEVVTFLMKETV
jgi:GNAT superfamily N-acetyltransferase